MMRDGLRLCLRLEPDLEVIGEADDGSTALRRVAELSPDVVVLDIGLPDSDGISLARQIRELRPKTRIVILTGLVDREHLDQALGAGINCYLLKADGASQLTTAIRRAMRNEPYISSEITAVLVGKYQELLASKRQNDQALPSEREEAVLKLIANGLSTKEIAGDLGVSVKSIETHRRRIMAKLGFRGVADLTKYAIRKGLTSP